MQFNTRWCSAAAAAAAGQLAHHTPFPTPLPRRARAGARQPCCYCTSGYVMSARGNIGAGRLGTDNDGSDHQYRQRVANVYQIRADCKKILHSRFLGMGVRGICIQACMYVCLIWLAACVSDNVGACISGHGCGWLPCSCDGRAGE
jgi:hypothetical protein